VSCGGLAFSPDGKRLACGGSSSGPELIDIATGQLNDLYPPVVSQTITGGYDVNAVAFSPGAAGAGGAGLLASGNSNGTATLWDAAAQLTVGAPLSKYLAHGTTARGIGLVSDGQLLDGPHSNGYAHLIASPGPSGAGRDVLGFSGMAFSPDGLLAAAPAGHYLQLLDARTGKTRLRLPAAAGQHNTVTGALFSPDGGIVASVDQQGMVRLWSTATGAAIGVPLGVAGGADLGVLGGQSAMAFSPNGRLFAAASMDGYVSLVGTATGLPDGAPLPVDPVPRSSPSSVGNGQPGPPAPPPTPPSPSEGDRINTVAFSPDGRLLVAAGADGYIRIWDVNTRRPADGPIPAAIGTGIRSVAFSPAGTVLASVAGDGSARLWDPTSGTPVGVPLSMGTNTLVTDPVLASFSHGGGLIALMTSIGYVVAWPEWLVANPHHALCEQVGPPPNYVWSKYAQGAPEPDMCR
jgi:WD40 repeat protein